MSTQAESTTERYEQHEQAARLLQTRVAATYGRALRQIDRALIEAALERSPTGGNSKPFSWTWAGDVLHIHHDAKLAEHYLNRNQHTSWIALGCLITSLEVAAAAQNLVVETSIDEDEGPSASARFVRRPMRSTATVAESKAELQALMTRQTFRGPLAQSPAPAPKSASSSGVKTRLVPASEVSKTTKKYLTAADSYLWIQKNATRDFFKEITFSTAPQGANDRGIRTIDLGISKADQMTLRILSRAAWLPSIMAQIPGLNASFKAATKRTLKNAHLLLISAKNLEPKNLVEVGREAMKSWIDLESQGYKVQPLSMASITLVDAATDHLPADTKTMFRDLFETAGPAVLRQQFGLTETDQPVWLLRVGRPS